MTERWHPTKTLVGLPGMPPKSTRAITLHGPERGWVSRQRRDGNGLEWLESSLPAETRAALARTGWPAPLAIPAAAGAGEEAVRPDGHGGTASQPAPQGRMAAIADARLAVLVRFDKWRAASGGGVLLDDARRFVALYNDGDIQVEGETRSLVKRVSYGALMRWRKRLRERGWAGLAPRSGAHRQGAGIIDRDAELGDFIAALILERPGHVNCRFIMQALRARFDAERLPSYRTVQLWVARWRRENARLISAVADPDAHRSRRQPAFGSASAGIERLNQLWELDGTAADVICSDGRFKIGAAIDVFSRRAGVLVCPAASAESTCALLRARLLAWGVPERVRTDLGPEFVARRVRRALADLAIEHEELPAYSPERKPHIERFFHTLSRFCERLPGFAGHSIAEQVAIRAHKSFAQRRGEGDEAAFSVALSATELQAALDDWIANVYEREPHGGLGGRSPYLMAAGRPLRTIDDERALDVLLAPPASGDGWRVVSKHGISAEGTTFIAPELGALVCERVEVRLDIADAGAVYVFDADGRFVARAVAPDRAGVDRAALAAAAKAHARRADAEGRAYARKIKRAFRPEHAWRDVVSRGAEEAADVVPFPAPEIPHEAPALDETARATAARPGPKPLSDADRAAAAEARAARESAGAATVSREEARAILEGRARRVAGEPKREPVCRPDGAPINDDVAFALWVEDNPELADDADRALVADYLESGTFRHRLERARRRRDDGEAESA